MQTKIQARLRFVTPLRITQGLLLAMLYASAQGQVTAPSAEDNASVPEAFRTETLKAKGPAAFAPRGTPQGYVPNPDPRDFTGSYVTAASAGGPPPGGGAPGGAPGGPPGGGAGPGGGPPPSGAAPGANAGNNAIACVPSFGSGAYATHIVSSTNRVTVVGEENHRLRRFYIGAQHPKNVQPTYAADSIAHWEGNTLVVDTIAIKGQPGTHLLERWTKQADGSIQIVTSYLDADNKPTRTQTSGLTWRPDITYIENICEDFGEAFDASYQQKTRK